MKLQDLEDGQLIATKLDLREMRLEILERMARLEERMGKLDERMGRVERLIWLPVAASVAQIVVALWHR